LASRSPGALRSRCRDQRQLGQWLRCVVPGASLDTATPQWPQVKEREKAKSYLSKRREGVRVHLSLLSLRSGRGPEHGIRTAVARVNAIFRPPGPILILLEHSAHAAFTAVRFHGMRQSQTTRGDEIR
jgi:hypothetical protein